MYGMGGTVSCVFVTISSPRSHTYKQHVFPASSRLKPPFVQRPDESARSTLRGAPSLNPSLAPADVADHPLHRPASP